MKRHQSKNLCNCGFVFYSIVFATVVMLPTSAKYYVLINLCQRFLFLHQLTNNMTTDCLLNYKFNTWKFQAQTCCVQKLFLTFRTSFVHNMFSPCSAKRRASDKDVPVPYLFYYFLLSDFFATNLLTKQWPDRVQKRLRGAEKSTICTTILLFMRP